MSRDALGRQVCEYVHESYREAHESYREAHVGADIKCFHGSDPKNDPGPEYRPEIPWVPYVIRVGLGTKTVEIGFASGLWERDATDYQTIKEHMERHGWMDLVAQAADWERIVFHDGGWYYR